MTGWRVGYLAGPRAVIGPAARVHRTALGSLNTAVQIAAVEALRLPHSVIEAMLIGYRRRRDVLLEVMTHAAGVGFTPPEGAFYALLRYDADMPSIVVTEELARRGVMVRAGSEFGPSGEGHIRISFAVSETDLRTGLERLLGYFGGRT
jgi:aspartate aminotransferase